MEPQESETKPPRRVSIRNSRPAGYYDPVLLFDSEQEPMSENELTQQSENPTPTSLLAFGDQFSVFTGQVVNAMEKVSKVAEKGPVILLLTLGTVLFVAAIGLKVEIGGMRFSNLAPSEFIALAVSATLMLILGSLIRLYQYKSWQDITKEQQKIGGELLKKTVETAKKMVEEPPMPPPPL
jgi:hypothetical protein